MNQEIAGSAFYTLFFSPYIRGGGLDHIDDSTDSIQNNTIIKVLLING